MKKIIFLAFIVFLCYIISQTDLFKNFFQTLCDAIDEARQDIIGVQDSRDNALGNYFNRYFKKVNSPRDN